jgi:hypothetical protein
MTSSSTANPSLSHANDPLRSSKAILPGCMRPSSIFLPVANPVAAAALVEDDESTAIEGQATKSMTSSPSETSKSHAHVLRPPAACSVMLTPSAYTNSKAILNVGGVRHEGN